MLRSGRSASALPRNRLSAGHGVKKIVLRNKVQLRKADVHPEESNTTRMTTRHMGTKHVPVGMVYFIEDPKTFKEEVCSEDTAQWCKAMHSEIE